MGLFCELARGVSSFDADIGLEYSLKCCEPAKLFFDPFMNPDRQLLQWSECRDQEEGSLGALLVSKYSNIDRFGFQNRKDART